MLHQRVSTWIAVALVGATFAGSALAAPSLESRIETESAFVTQQDDVWVRVVVENKGKEAAKILRYHLPIESAVDDLFSVTYDGEQVEYLGRHYKRPAPRPEDWFVLAPGKSVESRVELSKLYDLSRGGEYVVAFMLPGEAIFGSRNRDAVSFSNETSLWMDGDAVRAEAPVAATETRALNPTYRNCSNGQQSALATALSNGQSYAEGARDYLITYPSATRANSVRYKTWFGTYTSANWSRVQSNFTNIASAMGTQQFTFDCGCSDPYYAYVYSNQPYIVYLCNAFWSAPATGTDSKAGTLVHETSHFSVVAGTADHAYGQTACKNLANRSPKKAIANADSHEYFAENTPSQP